MLIIKNKNQLVPCHGTRAAADRMAARLGFKSYTLYRTTVCERRARINNKWYDVTPRRR